MVKQNQPKGYTLNDIKNIISKYNTYTEFVNGNRGVDYEDVRKFVKKEFGDNYNEKFNELTKSLKDIDENIRLEKYKSQLKNLYKNNPEWNFDNITLTKNKYSNIVVNRIYCLKHNTYKDNSLLDDLKSNHTTPCVQCSKENSVRKFKDTNKSRALKGDESVEKYKESYGKKEFDDDYLISITQKYKGKNINIFRQEKPLEYLAILDRGVEFMNNVFLGFIFKPYPGDYLDVLKKYYENKSYTEFRENNINAYEFIKKRGPYISDPKTGEQINTYEFLKEFTKNMIRTGNLSKRMIYAHEFYDGKKPVAVYVGLTWNEEQRYKSHTSGVYKDNKVTTPVTKFIKENPKLKHVYKRLTDYVDEVEALKLEDEWERKYKLDGWMILNVRRIFSLGNRKTRKPKLVLNIDDLRDSINSFIKLGLDYDEIKLKYPALINTIRNNRLSDKLLKNVKGYKRNRTIDELKAAVLQYDSVSELRNRDLYLYESFIDRIGSKELHKMYEDKRNNKMK
jgi:hypothetical protein